jgi:hypothetical protein
MNKHLITIKSYIKSTVFWDITGCSPLKVNRRFGVKYSLHLLGRRVSRVRNQRESRWQACFHSDFLLCLFFEPEDGGDIFLETSVYFQWTTRHLSQKIILFLATAVIISNLYIIYNMIEIFLSSLNESVKYMGLKTTHVEVKNRRKKINLYLRQ